MNTRSYFHKFVQGLWPSKSEPKRDSANHKFDLDPTTGVAKRCYESYSHYVEHQAAKLGQSLDEIVKSDNEYEGIVAGRYREIERLKGASILCLAARLGGEVRAFKSLGALAIGIDVQPGPNNPHVLPGDFHNIQFPDACFDAAFTNAIDHVFDLPKFLSEVSRVLKPNGVFYVELAAVKPGKYEVLDTSDTAPLIGAISKVFEIEVEQPIVNQTEYVNWEGTMLTLHNRRSSLQKREDCAVG